METKNEHQIESSSEYGRCSTISIITLNVNSLDSLIKREMVKVDLKNMTHLYIVYKKSTLNIKIQID